MEIVFTCPGCRKLFKIHETMAGRRATCPKCATVFRVPAPPQLIPPAPPPDPPRPRRSGRRMALFAAVAVVAAAVLIGAGMLLGTMMTRTAVAADTASAHDPRTVPSDAHPGSEPVHATPTALPVPAQGSPAVSRRPESPSADDLIGKWTDNGTGTYEFYKDGTCSYCVSESPVVRIGDDEIDTRSWSTYSYDGNELEVNFFGVQAAGRVFWQGNHDSIIWGRLRLNRLR